MIFIDAMALVPEKVSGVGQYIKSFVSGLDANGVDYRLFVTKGKKALLAERYPAERIIEIPIRYKTLKLLDALHVAPRVDRYVGIGTYFFGSFQNWPLSKRSTSLTCFHDMAFMAVPQTVEAKNLLTLRYFYRRWYRRASTIVTVSQFSRAEIIKYLGNGKPVIILENTVNPAFLRYETGRPEPTLAKYGITEKNYLLFVGNIEPRKGLHAFFDAYSRQDRGWRLSHPVIMVGGMGWKSEAIERLIDAINRDAPTVVRPSRYVTDADLPAFYALATAVILPSDYEGFGIPIIEAAATNTMVYATAIEPFIEVLGKYGFKQGESFIMGKEYSLDGYEPATGMDMSTFTSETAIKGFLENIHYVAGK